MADWARVKYPAVKLALLPAAPIFGQEKEVPGRVTGIGG